MEFCSNEEGAVSQGFSTPIVLVFAPCFCWASTVVVIFGHPVFFVLVLLVKQGLVKKSSDVSRALLLCDY